MSEIYVLCACYDYEGSAAITAFEDKGAADDLAAKCNEYRGTRPPQPQEMMDTHENDAEWQKWYALNEDWEQAHPAGAGYATADSFKVFTVPFVAREGA
jgi:hypothetical protein